MLGRIVGNRFFSTKRGIPWAEAMELKKVVLYEPELDESFVKGSGKGGQKINKVRNCVLLQHLPTGLAVQCQKTRKLEDNRRIARNLLLSKMDDLIHGENSKRNLKIKQLQRKKARKKAKTTKKYHQEEDD